MCLSGPFYLEYSKDHWILQGYCAPRDLQVTINFVHLNAKIWQKLLEIIEKIGNFDFSIKFDNLIQSTDEFIYNFMESSSFDNFNFPNSTEISNFKTIDWNDLCSSKVILYGVYLLEAALMDNSFTGSSEESLGNLSILPNPNSCSYFRLKCPHDDKLFIYPENCGILILSSLQVNGPLPLLIQVKTVLNDGNVNEIIRRSVYIIKTMVSRKYSISVTKDSLNISQVSPVEGRPAST